MDKAREIAERILKSHLPGDITWEEVEMMIIALNLEGRTNG